ncbi:signal peptidase [Desulfuribacillus stibiiarsenatis]|uniref:Signal peptidase n=1 Tax=Desulfuribacillus stibiiarsenatis TaxID=1390249 RepID=A0A1E5L9P7_9FIRM|nr:signal peptide peptidase SppA [Desulfuribacillus stibiiarsenatis]OEH86663.1 signal peptidase [Desulfuribacillus stibiiarsenatis]
MNHKRWIAVAIFLALFFVSTATPMKPMDWPTVNNDWIENVYQDGGNDRIALLEIDGEIVDVQQSLFPTGLYNHDMFLRQLEQAFSDAAIKAVVLQVNSPGGGVYESDEIYNSIRKLKKQYNKPIVVYMSKMAASGGYFVSAPADYIIANRNTLTGSIGVILGNLNFKELMERYGVKDQTFTSGPNKAIMSPYQDLTEEQRVIMQSIIDDSYQYFVDIIVEGRNMERSRVLEIADGRIYTGSQAKEIGLVDDLGQVEDAIAKASDLAGVVNPTVITYTADQWSQFRSLLYKAPKLFRSTSDLQELLPASHPNLMYIWNW